MKAGALTRGRARELVPRHWIHQARRRFADFINDGLRFFAQGVNW